MEWWVIEQYDESQSSKNILVMFKTGTMMGVIGVELR